MQQPTKQNPKYIVNQNIPESLTKQNQGVCCDMSRQLIYKTLVFTYYMLGLQTFQTWMNVEKQCGIYSI